MSYRTWDILYLQFCSLKFIWKPIILLIHLLFMLFVLITFILPKILLFLNCISSTFNYCSEFTIFIILCNKHGKCISIYKNSWPIISDKQLRTITWDFLGLCLVNRFFNILFVRWLRCFNTSKISMDGCVTRQVNIDTDCNNGWRTSWSHHKTIYIKYKSYKMATSNDPSYLALTLKAESIQ